MRAHLLGHAGRGQQPAVGEFGAVRQHLLRRAADEDQPALGLGPGGRDNVLHLAVHLRRDEGGQLLHPVHHHLRRGLGDREALLDELLAQRVHDEGEAADVAELAGRVQQPWLDVEFGDDLLELVVGQFAGVAAQVRQDHRLQRGHADHLVEQVGRDVDHQVDLALLVEGQLVVVHGRGDDRLALQVGHRADGLDLAEGAHDQVRLGHGIGHAHVLQPGQRLLQQPEWLLARHQLVAAGVQLQLRQRAQQHRRAGLEHRVGKAQVLGVVRQRHRDLVVAHARQEQHTVVVEVAAQFLLNVAHGAHLQQPAQRGAGGHRHARHHLEQLLGLAVDDRAQAHVVVVGGLTQADRIGVGLLAAQHLPGLAVVTVGAHALDGEALAEEIGLELEILLGRAQRDRDDLLHVLASVVDVQFGVFLAARVFFAAGLGGSTWRISASHCCCVM
jgi:hypothetical protein